MLVARLYGIVVFVVGRTSGIDERAEGLGTVLQLLMLIAEVQTLTGRSSSIAHSRGEGEDVAVVVGIGNGIG